MAENRRSKDKRFYFSRGQLVLLGGAFALASAIIFALGMFVGKGIEERRVAKSEEPSTRIPVKPSAQSGGAPQAKEELTFYDTLTKSPAQAVAEEKPMEIKQPESVAKADLKSGKAQPKEKPAAAAKPVEKKLEKASAPAEAAQKTAPADTVEAKQTDKDWTVQVNAFPDERSAKIWVDKLKGKGYNAYSAEVRNKGKLWYRVRVGKYATREEADRALENLKSKENFTKAFATSR